MVEQNSNIFDNPLFFLIKFNMIGKKNRKKIQKLFATHDLVNIELAITLSVSYGLTVDEMVEMWFAEPCYTHLQSKMRNMVNIPCFVLDRSLVGYSRLTISGDKTHVYQTDGIIIDECSDIKYNIDFMKKSVKHMIETFIKKSDLK